MGTLLETTLFLCTTKLNEISFEVRLAESTVCCRQKENSVFQGFPPLPKIETLFCTISVV